MARVAPPFVVAAARMSEFVFASSLPSDHEVRRLAPAASVV